MGKATFGCWIASAEHRDTGDSIDFNRFHLFPAGKKNSTMKWLEFPQHGSPLSNTQSIGITDLAASNRGRIWKNATYPTVKCTP